MIEKSTYEETPVKLSEEPAKSVDGVPNEKAEDDLSVTSSLLLFFLTPKEF